MARPAELTAALKHWGLTFDVNQAGPLLEQMAKQWEVRIDTAVIGGPFSVAWRGEYGIGDSILAAALDCIQEKHKAMFGSIDRNGAPHG